MTTWQSPLMVLNVASCWFTGQLSYVLRDFLVGWENKTRGILCKRQLHCGRRERKQKALALKRGWRIRSIFFSLSGELEKESGWRKQKKKEAVVVRCGVISYFISKYSSVYSVYSNVDTPSLTCRVGVGTRHIAGRNPRRCRRLPSSVARS